MTSPSQRGGPGLRRFVRPPAAEAGPADIAGSADTGVSAGDAAPAGNGVAPGDVVTAPNGSASAAPAERCEMCATDIPAEHSHIADLESASLLCACRACYLLFTQPGKGKYRAVPDRYLADPGRVMPAVRWDQLEIPVGLSFFLHSSREDGKLTGFYPSPAGATECILNLEQWQQLVDDYPLLGEPDADVEAALVSRSDAGVEYFVVPIDACYELAGRMRMLWRGFDGGSEARQSISDFLDMVRSRARTYQEA